VRCPWPGDDPLYLRYHDEEWGVPSLDERHLFEMLILEGMQAGLSWITVLRKRESFRAAFDGFDPERIARYDEGKIAALLQDTGIIRNRMKVRAAVANARAWLALKEANIEPVEWLWSFVDGRPIQNTWRSVNEIPVSSRRAEAMSSALRKRGCGFVGPTICYAFMQAVGMVNDHLVACFRHRELSEPRTNDRTGTQGGGM
jgi:DNA-3-methyladenine glycosylase I